MSWYAKMSLIYPMFVHFCLYFSRFYGAYMIVVLHPEWYKRTESFQLDGIARCVVAGWKNFESCIYGSTKSLFEMISFFYCSIFVCLENPDITKIPSNSSIFCCSIFYYRCHKKLLVTIQNICVLMNLIRIRKLYFYFPKQILASVVFLWLGKKVLDVIFSEIR